MSNIYEQFASSLSTEAKADYRAIIDAANKTQEELAGPYGLKAHFANLSGGTERAVVATVRADRGQSVLFNRQSDGSFKVIGVNEPDERIMYFYDLGTADDVAAATTIATDAVRSLQASRSLFPLDEAKRLRREPDADNGMTRGM